MYDSRMGILAIGTQKLNWFGEGAAICQFVSDFDRFKNDIDCFVHLFPSVPAKNIDGTAFLGKRPDIAGTAASEERGLAEGVLGDFDPASINCIGFKFYDLDGPVMNKELDQLQQELGRGELATVKYFQTTVMTRNGNEIFRKVNFSMPRVTIYGSEKLWAFAEAYLGLSSSEESGGSGVSDPGPLFLELREHIFREIGEQLERGWKGALEAQPPETVAIYEAALKAFKTMRNGAKEP